MTLGEKIRQARRCGGLSQGQLAEKICVSRSAIAKWETDKGLPDVENLKMLARLLHISVDSLLEDREPEGGVLIREAYDPEGLARTGCWPDGSPAPEFCRCWAGRSLPGRSRW